MQDRQQTVIVAGAGLGGLTLALCLARAGFAVTVLEQAKVLGEVGAGVQISANGSRVLYHLGLAAALNVVGFTPERGEMRHWRTGGVEPLVRRWQAAAHPVGTPLQVHGADGELTSGQYEGLDAGGSLQLRDATGSVHTVHAGDVSLAPKD